MASKKRKVTAAQLALELPSQQSSGSGQEAWSLVTNHRNLCYMLAAGMVMSPRGFGRKYYADSLSVRPGWLPLFRGAVPREAVASAVAEGRGQIPCLVRLRLGDLESVGWASATGDRFRELAIRETIGAEDRMLLVPAPLPTGWISGIAFPGQEELDECKAYAAGMDNVPLGDFSLEVEPGAFDDGGALKWPPAVGPLSDFDLAPDVPQAYGATLALFARFAERGGRALETATVAFDPESSLDIGFVGLQEGVRQWCAAGSVAGLKDISADIFWGCVNAVAKARSTGERYDPVGVLLGYLESRAAGLDGLFSKNLEKLVEDMREMRGFSDFTISEIFERHPKPFSRAMTLFCLRDTCEELACFEHQALTVDDFLNAAVLFAARDGWIGLCREMRSAPGLWQSVTHRMAALAHRLAGTGVRLGSAPERPRFVRELFRENKGRWTERQHKVALDLALRKGWKCVRTVIDLGKGDYQLRIDQRGARIETVGAGVKVETAVDVDSFVKDLGLAKLDAEDERRVREMLEA